MKNKFLISYFSISALLLLILSFLTAEVFIQIIQQLANLKFIATAPSLGILTLLKITSLIFGIYLSPVIIFLLFIYVKPALTEKELNLFKKVKSLLLFSYILFAVGSFFGSLIMFKIILPYLSSFNLKLNYMLLYSADTIITFIVMSIFYTGLVFQTPILTYYLLKLKLLKIENISIIRMIVLIGSLIIGALITPPDVFSQLLFSLPIYVLFESGVMVFKLNNRRLNK